MVILMFMLQWIVNCLPGPLRSRAAKAIGFIDDMINYSLANAPLQKELEAGELLLLQSLYPGLVLSKDFEVSNMSFMFLFLFVAMHLCFVH
jgi:hypothetical protein